MTRSSDLPLLCWLTTWRLARRYHRYEVVGLEHLERPGAALLVGYHGRPIAYDLCMLLVTVYERLGYMPHASCTGTSTTSRS